jgi:hypothetical protein
MCFRIACWRTDELIARLGDGYARSRYAETAITLKNTDNESQRSVVTDAQGHYLFAQVAPGHYSLTAERTGFATTTRTGIVLQVNTPTSLNVQLEIGKTTGEVTVIADVTSINTTDASTGNAFTEHQIRQLPWKTRNVIVLLSLQPGVTPTGEVPGSRRDQNNVLLDGVDVNDNQDSGISASKGNGQRSNANGVNTVSGFNSVLPIPLDSVQEFRVTVAAKARTKAGRRADRWSWSPRAVPTPCMARPMSSIAILYRCRYFL